MDPGVNSAGPGIWCGGAGAVLMDVRPMPQNLLPQTFPQTRSSALQKPLCELKRATHAKH